MMLMLYYKLVTRLLKVGTVTFSTSSSGILTGCMYQVQTGMYHVQRCYGIIPTCTALYRDVPGTYQHVLLPQGMYWYVPGTYHLPLVRTGTY